MTTTLRPAAITLNKTDGYLEIKLSADSTCRYPLSELREACPCAECRGGHSRMGREYDPANILELKPKRVYTVKSLELVGNYGLQPTWDDGHHTGIYTWEYLQRICPPSAPADTP